MRKEPPTSSSAPGNRHTPVDLRIRTKDFALAIIRLHARMNDRGAAGIIGRQLLRSGTSVGAQYREACRSRSQAEFISKMESSLQEIDETSYWFELLKEGALVKPTEIDPLLQEADELTRIFVASVTTAKSHR